MIVTISQPRYLPFQGYLSRIDRSDRFILLDNVQYSRHDWENRNRIKTAQGATWLTVPVKAKLGMPIPEVRIDAGAPWQSRHWRTLEQSYARAPHFDWLAESLRPVYEDREWDDLTTLNTTTSWLLADLLDIQPDVVRASDLDVTGTGSELILELCRAVDADTYLSGPEGRNYLDVAAFERAGITILYQDFEPAPHPQLHGDFVGYLSVVDLLCNCGADSAAFLRDSQPAPVKAVAGVKVLVVAAHPDDEILGCGATVAGHVDRGDEVHALILAEGSTSRSPRRGPTVDDPELRHLRACAQAAAAVLGTSSVRFGELPDNRMDRLDLLDVVKLVESVIDEVAPTVVYTHHHGDLNIDHRIAHAAALTAARPLPGSSVESVYAFEIVSSTEWSPAAEPFTPQRFVDVTATFDRKLAALRCYESEMRPFPHARSMEALQALATTRGASVGRPLVEAFTVVRELC